MCALKLFIVDQMDVFFGFNIITLLETDLHFKRESFLSSKSSPEESGRWTKHIIIKTEDCANIPLTYSTPLRKGEGGKGGHYHAMFSPSLRQLRKIHD